MQRLKLSTKDIAELVFMLAIVLAVLTMTRGTNHVVNTLNRNTAVSNCRGKLVGDSLAAIDDAIARLPAKPSDLAALEHDRSRLQALSVQLSDVASAC